MAEKNKGKVDPVAIRELISQGIPMKKKESEMAASAVVEEKKNDMTEVPQETVEESHSPIRTRRRKCHQGRLYITLHAPQWFVWPKGYLHLQRIAG